MILVRAPSISWLFVVDKTQGLDDLDKWNALNMEIIGLWTGLWTGIDMGDILI